jgi:beta-lactamase regulating signal transducer with metallopeptidase domain
MRFVESLIGLQALWQVEMIVGASVRIAVLVAVATALSLWVGQRNGKRLHVLWRTALLASIVILVIQPLAPRRSVPMVSPDLLVRADNSVYVDGVRAEIARKLGSSPSSGVVFGRESDAHNGPGVLAWLLVLWTAGSASFAARALVGAIRLRRSSRSAETLTDARIVDIARVAGRSIGMSRMPALKMSDRYLLPFTFGFANPVVLLPRQALSWSDERLNLVMRHELAHVERNDWIWQMLATIACIAYWFVPLVWIAARRQRLAAELACDDRAVQQGVEPAHYASVLVDLARSGSALGSTPAYVMPFSRRSELEHRVRALVTPPVSGGKRRAHLAYAMLLLLLPVLTAVRPSVGRCVGEEPAPAVQKTSPLTAQ